MTGTTRRPQSNVGVFMFLLLPCTALFLSAFAWVTAVSRSGFWADDFLNVTHFGGTLGDLSDNHINAGKYIINIFWAIGTEAFGAGSVIPFLLLNSLVFVTGLIIWLCAGTKSNWSRVDAWWIGGLFIATAAWFPTALWSSNITHSGGFLALGLAIVAHHRAMDESSKRGILSWSVASGAAWTFAVVSNLIYIGLMVIAIYCAWHQIRKLRGLGMEMVRAASFVGAWNLLLPVVYFATVAYPGTTAKSIYAKSGLRFVHDNLRYYRFILAPTVLLVALYIVLLVGAIIGSFFAMRRKDFFPVAVLGAAAGTALPALVQSQQRYVNYMAMPLLLVFSSFAAGARPALTGESKWLKSAVPVGSVIMLLLLFRQGESIRSYFVESPYGSSLTAFRSEAASLTPMDGVICARLDLDVSSQAFFIAAMSGEDGFLVPPISASQAYLVTNDSQCPANSLTTHITVSQDVRGNFVASK
jgi:hypothetical protein